MKAYIRNKYCGPEKLELKEFQKPTPKADEILVKVRATSINPADWHLMRGTPYMIRLMMGFPKPKNPFIGADVSGVVEAVGKEVTQFRKGDEVFTDVSGTGAGAFAEYVCIKASFWVKKPESISHQEAAAAPLAGLTAWQGLTEHGHLKTGQSVLIIGGSGGVGSYAVQLAKHLGAHVTAVCSTSKVGLVKSIGADKVIDYTQQNYTQLTERFDLIFDGVGSITPSVAKRLLKTNGTCLLIGWGGFGHLLNFGLGKLWVNKFSNKRLGSFTARMKTDDLVQLANLLESKKIKSVISDEYKFSDLRGAIAYQEKGHAAGKVVITVSG